MKKIKNSLPIAVETLEGSELLPPAPPTTYACVGNGESLRAEDVALLKRDDVRVIVINDAYEMAPWAFGLYAADYRWWAASLAKVMRVWQNGALYSLDEEAVGRFGLSFVKCEDLHKPLSGLPDRHSNAIRHGYSGGFQALMLARMLGGKRILLLGYDYHGGHAVRGAYAHAQASDFRLMSKTLDAVAPALRAEGTEVINCTPGSVLTGFERGAVAEILQ